MPNLSSYHARWGAILEHPDVARAMLGFGQLNDALDFLQKIEAASKQIGYWRPERLILQSMAWRKKGHKSRVPSSVPTVEMSFAGAFLCASPSQMKP